MNIAMAWGRAIETQRRLVNLSQQELAEACGVTQSTVSRWEQGTHAPSHHHIPKIAAALKTAPSVLFQYPQAVAQ